MIVSKNINDFYPDLIAIGSLANAIQRALRDAGSRLAVTELDKTIGFVVYARVQLGSRSSQIYIAEKERSLLWLAASCIRLPGLDAHAATALQEGTICVSIPQREAMLLFPFGTRDQRDRMRALIRKNEEHARKLVTWELFTLSAAGLQPLVES